MSSRRHLTAGVAVVLIAAAFAVYANSLRAPFILDDIPAILENPSIRDLRDLGAVLSPPNTGSGATGRPLVNLSFALNFAIGGEDVLGYHLGNVGIHALAALVLFGLLRRTFVSPHLPAWIAAASTKLAAACALLWTVHPLQTESVTCIVQRTESLAGLFYLLTLYGFVRASDAPRSARWMAMAWLAALAGVATKEILVTAPVMALFYDRTFIAGTFAAAWRRRWRWYLALASTWWLLAWLVAGAGANRGAAAGFGLGMSSWDYLTTQARAIVLYLKLSVWPDPLIADYGTVVFRRWSEFAIPGAVVVALVALTIRGLARRAPLAFAGVWFFAILAPSSSVVPLLTQTIAEHRMYLPLAAVIAVGVLGLFRVAPRLAPAWCLGLAVAAGAGTVLRNTDYRSEVVLWQDTVAKWPAGARPRANLGRAHFLRGEWAEAIAHYEQSLALDRQQPKTEYNLALALDRAGRPDDAIAAYARALALVPDFGAAHLELGRLLRKLGRFAAAEPHLRAAVRLQPDLAAAHGQLGLVLVDTGRLAEGTAHYATAVRLDPTLVDVESNWGAALYQAGDLAGALRHLERAAALDPQQAEVQFNLGLALVAAGRGSEARGRFAAAVRLRPDHFDARLNHGVALAQDGELIAALAEFDTALALRPDAVNAHVNRGHVLTELGRLAEAAAAYDMALRIQPDHAEARALRNRLPAAP